LPWHLDLSIFSFLVRGESRHPETSFALFFSESINSRPAE
jgi:hypothetical protein